MGLEPWDIKDLKHDLREKSHGAPGWLNWSIEHVTDSCSWGREFKPHLACGAYLERERDKSQNGSG